MNQCEYCGKSIQNQSICPNCGTTVYSAIGKIICGPTAKDMSCCSITVTDKYIIVSRMTKGEANAKRTGGAFGLLGYLVADAATTKERSCGYYSLSNIAKGIFPYLATGIKKKNAIKLINKDGTDFILIVDQPGFVDSVWKALKKTVSAIQQSIPIVEDGKGKNFGSIICSNPYVTLESFDKIRPGQSTNAHGSTPFTAAPPKPQSSPSKSADNTVIITPPPKSTETSTEINCNNCGAKLTSGSKFCSQCGEKVIIPQIKKKNCLRCGEPLKPVDKFCSNCGYQIK